MGIRSWLHTNLRRPVYRLARQLTPPRDEAFRGLLRSMRDLVEGREPRPFQSPEVRFLSPGLEYDPNLDRVEPIPDDWEWTGPPAIEPGVIVRSVYGVVTESQRFDKELIDQLNEEYADRPLVLDPPSYEEAAKYRNAVRRIRGAHKTIGLRDKRVLEIGCGDGLEVWVLGTDLGCDAHGVDVQERASWRSLQGENVHYYCVDLTHDNPFGENEFDRVISYAVWEHVQHPLAMLRETFKILRPGGLAYIRANLYAGPMASHRYRDLVFPWPHILFSDDVIKDWDRSHGRPPRGASWVNRLSWSHYEKYLAEVGFVLKHLAFQEAKWDQEFYLRFEQILGRYPYEDLNRDFFTAILEKPGD